MRVVKQIAKWGTIVFGVLAILGFVYNQVGLGIDRRLAPPKSEMVTVNGRLVHVACLGQGPRTFILDAGLGGWSIEWWRIQDSLATMGRVCAFDRAGTGWSDASSQLGHDGFAAADELREILAAGGIHRPVFYVGHSLGANFAQIYYSRYPADVAGLILLEPGDPKDLLEDFRGSREDAMNASECRVECIAATIAGELGVGRLVSLNAPGKSFRGDLKAQYRAGLARPSYIRSVAMYYDALPKTAYQNLDMKSFGDTPVLVFSSSQMRSPERKETEADVARWTAGYRAYLASIAARSSRGTGPVAVPESTHVSMVLGEPQAAMVVKTISSFVTHLEGSSKAPTRVSQSLHP